MSHYDDVREGGWWVLQDHNPDASLVMRRAMGAVRNHQPASDEDSSGKDPKTGQLTEGDIQGGMLWFEKDQKRRGLNSWWLTGVGVVAASGGGGPKDIDPNATKNRGGPAADGQSWAPARTNGFDVDDRYETKALNGHPQFCDMVWPKGWGGLASSGSDEASQQELLFPGFWGLVAVNAAGDPRAGTQVFDLKEDGSPDTKRVARLQSHLAVLDLTPGGGGLTGKTIAIQLGKGGRIDGGKGGAVFVDYDYSEVAGGAMDQGGPFTSGRGFCQHMLGKDADGKAIRPLHLATNSLFICSYGDAPLLFSPEPYAPTTVPDTGIWQPVYLRLDKELSHQAGAAGGVGFWRWETSAQLYIPPPIGDRWPPPPGGDPPPIGDGWPPPTGDPVPGTDPKPPPTGGGDPSQRNPRIPTGQGLLTPTELVGGVLQGSGNAPPPGPLPEEFYDPPWGPTGTGGSGRTPTPGAGGSGRTPTTAGLGYGTGIIGDGGKPAIPHSPSCIALPNVVFKASATLPGSKAISGNSAIERTALATWADSPQTGQLEGWAKGDGSWEGFVAYRANTANSWAGAIGGVSFLPPDVSMADLLERPATTTTASAVSVGVPAGLARLDLGLPNRSTGLVPGFSLYQDPATGTASLRTLSAAGVRLGGLDVTTAGVVTAYDVTGLGSALGGGPKGFLQGLQIACGSTATATVSAGVCRNKGNTADLTVSAAVTINKATVNAALGYERRAL